MLRASDFDFELPEQLIAQRPAAERDQSRLLVVGGGAERDGERLGHHRFAELPELLEREVPGALLVLNDTRVVPARLRARKLTPDGAPGGQVELLLCEPAAAPGEAPSPGSDLRWRAMYRASKPLRDGGRLELLAPDGSPAGLPPVQVVREEGRLIFGNYFCDTAVSATVPVMVDDGGSCYFNVLYDAPRRVFMRLSVNGDG